MIQRLFFAVGLIFISSNVFATPFKGIRDIGMIGAGTSSLAVLGLGLFSDPYVQGEFECSSNPYLDFNSPASQLYEKYLDLSDSRTDLRGLRPWTKSTVGDSFASQVSESALQSEIRNSIQKQIHNSSKSISSGWILSGGWQTGYFFSESPTTPGLQIDANYRPLVESAEGHFKRDGHNSIAFLNLPISHRSGFHLVFEPYFSASSRESAFQDHYQAGIQKLYLAYEVGSAIFEVGQNSITQGVGRLDNMSFSGHIEPMRLVRLRTARPVRLPSLLKYLGPTQSEIFLTYTDDHQTPENSLFLATKFSIMPWSFLEIGFEYLVQFGGKGDYSKNPVTFFGEFVAQDDENPANRSFMLELRSKHFENRMQLYTQLFFEDCCNVVLFNTRDVMNLAGIYVQADRDRKLDFTFEFARTGIIAHRHLTYPSGFTYKNDLIGHKIGPDAQSFSLRSRYWFSSKTWMSLQESFETRGVSKKGLNKEPISTIVPSFEEPESRLRSQVSFFFQPEQSSSLWLQLELGHEFIWNAAFRISAERNNYLAGLQIRSGF